MKLLELDSLLSSSKVCRVTVPTFEIVSNPTISIAAIKQRRFTIGSQLDPLPCDLDWDYDESTGY